MNTTKGQYNYDFCYENMVCGVFYVRQKEGNNIDFKFGFLFQTKY